VPSPHTSLSPFQCSMFNEHTLSEAWSGVNWADLMAAQGTFETDFHDKSTRTRVGTMLRMEYRPVIKIGPRGALGSHEIRPNHSASSLGQSIDHMTCLQRTYSRDERHFNWGGTSVKHGGAFRVYE